MRWAQWPRLSPRSEPGRADACIVLFTTLFPALTGYYFLKSSKATRLTIPHESGYHLFFKSAIVGYLLVGVPLLVGAVLRHHSSSVHWVETVSETWQTLAPFDNYVGAYLAGTVLGGNWLLLERFLYDESAGFIRSARERGDQIGALVAEALGSEMFIEVTLRTRKAYIGIPLSMKNGQDADIELLPLQSGHRDAATQKLVMDTDYTVAIQQLKEDDAIDTRVIVSSSEIVTVKPFDPLLYQRFRQTNPGTPPLAGHG